MTVKELCDSLGLEILNLSDGDRKSRADIAETCSAGSWEEPKAETHGSPL